MSEERGSASVGLVALARVVVLSSVFWTGTSAVAAPQDFSLDQILVEESPKTSNSFGGLLDHDGATLIGGRGFGEPLGACTVFKRTPSGWILDTTLIPFDAEPGDVFAPGDSFTGMAVDGDFIALGSPKDDDQGDNSGSVYLYERDASGPWKFALKLLAHDGAAGDGFGSAVELSGDWLFVGAPGKGSGASACAAIYVYRRDVGNWAFSQVLTGCDSFGKPHIGPLIKASGDVLVSNAGGTDVVVVFRLVGSTWTEVQTLTPSNPLDENFGNFDLNGDFLIVVSASALALPTDGAAYLYQDVGGSFVEIERLVPAGTPPFDTIGQVGVSENVALVGRTSSSACQPANGCPGIVVFRKTSAGFAEVAKLPPGTSLVLVGPTLVDGLELIIGDPKYDDPCVAPSFEGCDVGAIRVYSLSSLWTDVDSLTVGPTAGVQTLHLDTGGVHAGAVYLVLGSVSGTAPGLSVDGLVLPLNVDVYTVLSLQGPNLPPLANSLGILGASGTATATFTLPANAPPALAGFTVHHAYLALDTPGGVPRVVFASTPAPLALQ